MTKKANSVKGSRRWARRTNKTAVLRAIDKGRLWERERRKRKLAEPE